MQTVLKIEQMLQQCFISYCSAFGHHPTVAILSQKNWSFE